MTTMSLKAARVNAGFTMNEAAKQLNVAVSTLMSWEHGETEPKVTQALQLAALYGVTVNNLIFLQKQST